MKKLRSPICWFGGKGRMTDKLMPLLPPHRIYVEPFGGGASLLFAKEPSPVEVYNDLDSGLVNFFRILRDPHRCIKLALLAMLTPYSREDYERYRRSWDATGDDVERAYQWFCIARQSMSGRFGKGWSFSVSGSTRGMAQTNSSWLTAIDDLIKIHARLILVQIEHNDFRRVIATYDSTETLFYLDPPYVSGTRRGGKYAHEMTDEDHADLVKILLQCQGKVLLSGYRNDIYKPLEKAGWRRKDFKVVCHATGRTRAAGAVGEGSMQSEKHQRVESVWISPNAQLRVRRKSKRSIKA